MVFELTFFLSTNLILSVKPIDEPKFLQYIVRVDFGECLFDSVATLDVAIIEYLGEFAILEQLDLVLGHFEEVDRFYRLLLFPITLPIWHRHHVQAISNIEVGVT